ncbi:MAG TPA: alpha/beta fold hydrolase [Pirellulales bacterium]|nr:alpha/beta fold hydrolase [Pirellulales bacterium]
MNVWFSWHFWSLFLLGPPPDRSDRCRFCLIPIFLATGVLLGSTGCQTSHWLVKKQDAWSVFGHMPFQSESSIDPSERTHQTLKRLVLGEELEEDPEQAFAQLQKILQQEPSAEVLYAYAEMAYLLATTVEEEDEKRAFDLYVTSAANACEYLFDERFHATRNAYDPQFRGACDLYNHSLASAMRMINHHGGLKPGLQHFCNVGTESTLFRISSQVEHLKQDNIKKLDFVSDYEISGLPNHYRTYGLGVPLIVERRPDNKRAMLEKHYPPGLTIPVTAYLRVSTHRKSDADDTTIREAVLELHNPLQTPNVQVAGQWIPLESDSTTPLAHFLDHLDYTDVSAATSGLLHPDESPHPSGLYMLEPYQPGKIPVLLVHGIWATPISWMTMFNDLRSIPEIRRHYQFWCYFYPTGEPFVYTAADLREQMIQLRKLLDPQRAEPALEQIVMIGHSMGGLISRLQSVDSGDLFWQQVASQPLDVAKADPDTRKQIERTFFFRANPSVRRVVTIATPFAGSDLSNPTTQWLGSKLIKPPKIISDSLMKLNRENPDLLREGIADLTPTSLEMLAPGSAALKALAAATPAPWVSYHNVIGRTEQRDFLHKVTGDGDGVVSVASAHAGDAISEIVVNADHQTIHSHPQTVREVRRILLSHLSSLQLTKEEQSPERFEAAAAYFR